MTCVTKLSLRTTIRL